MKTIALYWGYLAGEEHLTNEQFASIDFGNPSLDTEFITFDPLATSFFQGKYYTMYERRFAFPHRNLPSMRFETMVMYEDTSIKIIDPPVDLNTPVGIFLCIFTGIKGQIKKSLEFLGKKINLRFSSCEIDLEKFYKGISKTRLEILPKSMTVSNLSIDKTLSGNLEVFVTNQKQYIENLKSYKPQITELKFILKEVNLQIDVDIKIDGTISFYPDIENLNLMETIYDIASRSVFTGS
ncbi:MAG: hypothetical protein FK731_03680, partial [Asgard group archaeon]|nr:hypothetical protein [Asgard group archaeon]